MYGDKDQDIISFESIDKNIWKINGKKIGHIGWINYNEKDERFVFLPVKHLYYQAIQLAIILSYLNKLNNFKGKNKRGDI
jgi:hypothetical protein